MAPKNKKGVAKPYDRPVSSAAVQRNGTSSGQSSTMGGGDVEKTPMSSEFVTISSFNSLENTVKNLVETITKLSEALKDSQPRGVACTSDTDQPRGVEIDQTITTNNDNGMTDAVNNAIQDHLQTMMTNDNESMDNGKNFTSISMPVDLNVSDKIKQNIWSGEYVDFNTLLELDQPTEYTLKFIAGGDGNQINLDPAKMQKRLL
jgi:hypothetical protein